MQGVSEPRKAPLFVHMPPIPAGSLQEKPEACPVCVSPEEGTGGVPFHPEQHLPCFAELVVAALLDRGCWQIPGPRAVLISKAPGRGQGTLPSGPGGVLPGPMEVS